ncbi:MAG: RsmE family RNA methyltransferase [Acidimicrobiales bacterium]|nr:MAG: hypothetical protein MB52_04605 [marine actinobacterium MedAcidi-G1]HAQ03591.1 16S rRNA (uracil(1498)-N(3))-methyltransferase [Acidimicrobiaceae bacterium]
MIDTDLPHAFVDDIENPCLSDEDTHHFGKVLRLRSGDGLTVSNANGSWRKCVYGPPLESVSEITFEPKSEIEITIGFALVKKGKPELIVQKLTELGVDKIVPTVAQRSVVHWTDKKIVENEKRFNRIAREAAMQSRQVYIPEVMKTQPFSDLGMEKGITLAHPKGKKLTLDHSFLVIGPEGGWTPEEVEGKECCSLGESILRSETAAISAGVLLTSLRDGRVE